MNQTAHEFALRSLEGPRPHDDDRTGEADAVDSVVADLGETIAELRSLVANMPLPQLDAGLQAAFQELADRSRLPVHVEVVAGKLDPTVEATAYVRRLLLKLDLDENEDANRGVLAVMSYLGASNDRG